MRLATMRIFALCALILLTLCPLAQAETGNRFALVIGNSAYKDKPLKNPANDARDMASTLYGLGFNVQLKVDAGLKDMDEAIREFGNRLKKGGVGIFYYAGHGIQVSGVNYLVPIGARLSSESDAKYECVDAGRVLGKMEDAGNELNIVILDACRNNPFARSFRSVDQGLARMDAPTGSMVAYSTAPNSVASDGSGKNGVYTKHLLANLGTPGIPIEEVFKRVRIGVMGETGKKQVPWESSSIAGYYYIAGGQGGPVLAPATPSPSSLSGQAVAQANAERLKQEQKLKAYLAGLEAEKKQVEQERAELARRRQELDDEEAAKKLAQAQAPQEKRLKEQLAVLEAERKKLEQERAALERARRESEQAQKAAEQAQKAAQAAQTVQTAQAKPVAPQAALPQKPAPSAKIPAPRRMDREAVLQRLSGTWHIETQGNWRFPSLSLKPGGDTLYGSLEGDRRVVDRVDLTGLAVEGNDLHLRLAVHPPDREQDRGYRELDPRQRFRRAVAARRAPQAMQARVVECVGDLGAPGADGEIPVVCSVEGQDGGVGRSESGRMVRTGW